VQPLSQARSEDFSHSIIGVAALHAGKYCKRQQSDVGRRESQGNSTSVFSSLNHLIKDGWFRSITTVPDKQYSLDIVNNTLLQYFITVPDVQCFMTEALFTHSHVIVRLCLSEGRQRIQTL
jgi:hypothetical protein